MSLVQQMIDQTEDATNPEPSNTNQSLLTAVPAGDDDVESFIETLKGATREGMDNLLKDFQSDGRFDSNGSHCWGASIKYEILSAALLSKDPSMSLEQRSSANGPVDQLSRKYRSARADLQKPSGHESQGLAFTNKSDFASTLQSASYEELCEIMEGFGERILTSEGWRADQGFLDRYHLLNKAILSKDAGLNAELLAEARQQFATDVEGYKAHGAGA